MKTWKAILVWASLSTCFGARCFADEKQLVVADLWLDVLMDHKNDIDRAEAADKTFLSNLYLRRVFQIWLYYVGPYALSAPAIKFEESVIATAREAYVFAVKNGADANDPLGIRNHYDASGSPKQRLLELLKQHEIKVFAVDVQKLQERREYDRLVNLFQRWASGLEK